MARVVAPKAVAGRTPMQVAPKPVADTNYVQGNPETGGRKSPETKPRLRGMERREPVQPPFSPINYNN